MSDMQEVMRVSQEIIELLNPDLIILYGKKISVSSEKIKGFDLCIVADTEDKLETEKKVYSNVEASVPFNVKIYTKNEWQECIEDECSFANFINKKGTIIYEKR